MLYLATYIGSRWRWLWRNSGRSTRFLATREIMLLFSTYLIYSVSKNLIDSTPILRAFGNAWALVELEKSLGIAHESTIQIWASLHSIVILNFLGYFYAIALWVALLGSAAYLFVRSRRLYWPMRNIYLVTMISAVIIFAIYPLAPPRLLPGYGMLDVADALGMLPKEGSRSFFGYNEFAAMPSLHIAWSSLIVFAWFKLGSRWGKILSSIYLVVMTLAVVATANHYILDVVAGVLLLLFAMWVVGLPASVKKMLEYRDLNDLRELMTGWPQPFPESGFRGGYHRSTNPVTVPVNRGGSFGDEGLRLLS